MDGGSESSIAPAVGESERVQSSPSSGFPSKHETPSWTVNIRTSNAVRLAVLLRVLLSLRLVPSEVDHYLHRSALGALLVQTSFTPHEIKEAIALRYLVPPHRFSDAYAGNEVSLPPLLLASLEPIVKITSSVYLQHALWGILLLALDYFIAQKLEQITRNMFSRQNSTDIWESRLQSLVPDAIKPKLSHIFPIHTQGSNSSNLDTAFIESNNIPALIGLMYFANPATILATSVFQCYQNIRVLFFLSSLGEASQPQGSAVWSATCAAIACYIDPACVVFLVPITLLFSGWRKQAIFLFAFVAAFMYLLGLSFSLLGYERFVDVMLHASFSRFNLAGTPPSLSIFWYTKMELFLRFSTFFQVVLTCLPFTVVIPVAIRLYKYPLVMVAIYWLIWTILLPVGTLYELTMGLCLMAMSPRSLARVNLMVCVVSSCALVVPSILFVLLYWMWLEAGNGEANFLFFQCLAYNIFVVALLLQFVGASVQRDKALRMTEKMENSRNHIEREN